jgi:proteasome lid subunit RPN8/RPN11
MKRSSTLNYLDSYQEDASAEPFSVDTSSDGIPQIWIDLNAYNQMLAYVRLCSVEINGFARVRKLDNGIFVISDTFITEQDVSTGEATAEDAGMHKAFFEMDKAGFDIDELRCQWHSHVHGPTRFSKVDTATIDGTNADWWISLVFNKFGHVGCRLDQFRPYRLGLNLPLRVLVPGLSPEEIQVLIYEMELKVNVLPNMKWNGTRMVEETDRHGRVVIPPLFVADPEQALGTTIPIASDKVLVSQ